MVLLLSIRSFIHRIKYLGIFLFSYFDFYEVSFFATADKNLDPALPKLFWFTPAFLTCLTVAE
jgi:lipid-A-disaccharide synthase-like uncharacterized protein